MSLIRILFFISFTISITDGAGQLIGSNRRVNWQLAGLKKLTPDYTNVINITTFGGVGNGAYANDSALSACINSLGNDSAVIYFPPGIYKFNLSITLRSGIIIRGAGADNTIFNFNLPDSANAINFLGYRLPNVVAITETATKATNHIITNNSSSFQAGDYIKVFQNDSSLVYDVYNCVGQIIKIENISGDTLFLNSPLRRNYVLSDSPRIRKLIMTEGSGVECLSIKKMNSFTGTSNILFNYAVKCWVKGVESDSANFGHVTINNSSNIEVTGCYFHHAFSYGPGGEGYGVSVNYTSGECLIENNIFRRLRHSMLIQSGSNGNVFALNYSLDPYKSESQPYNLSGDIVLHGNYPYANLFEGNIIQNLVVDLSHGKNGTFNTFFRNRTESYGVLVNTASIDSSNFVGNEIVGAASTYIMSGTGNLEYSNNIRGSIFPIGTTNLNDTSYFYTGEPYYWTFARPFPTIGTPHAPNMGTIPAKVNYLSNTNLTRCPENLILPFELLVLRIETVNVKRYLHWQVNNNNNTLHYEIEMSNDGINFHKTEVNYPLSATNHYYLMVKGLGKYFRIKQVFKNRLYKYSNIVSVSDKKDAVKIFPNPAGNKLTISNLEFTDYSITDITGRTVVNATHTINIGSETTIFIHQLTKGVYYLKMRNKFTNHYQQIPFVKN